MAAKKKTTKKAAPAVRGLLKKAAPAEPVTKKAAPMRRANTAKAAPRPANDRISEVISKINAAHGGVVVRRASEAITSHALRRPTGIPELDIALAGGWPASALNVITGPDGAGKDYIINLSIGMVQQIYGNEARIAVFTTEFPYDKEYARDKCNVAVADTDEEIVERNAMLRARGEPEMSEEEVARRRCQIGEILLIQGVVMDHGLDIVLELLSTNEFHLIAINSIGVMETLAKEDTDSVGEHAVQSSEAQLLSRFIPKVFMLLNRVSEDGERNETTMLVADQVRANRDVPRARPGFRVPEHQLYKPGSGSRALAHGKAISLMLHKGADIMDNEVKPPEKLGREVNWELIKGKLGTHDGIKGSYEYFFDEGADKAGNLRAAAVKHGVIAQAGAWFEYKDPNDELSFRVQGLVKCNTELARPEVFAAVYAKTLTAAGVMCRYR